MTSNNSNISLGFPQVFPQDGQLFTQCVNRKIGKLKTTIKNQIKTSSNCSYKFNIMRTEYCKSFNIRHNVLYGTRTNFDFDINMLYFILLRST